MKIILIIITLLSSAIIAEEKDKKSSKSSQILGMSVTGNKESPRSLTIVPWRTPLMNGKSPMITPVWRPTLGLLDPDAYRRDVKLFLRMRTSNQNRH